MNIEPEPIIAFPTLMCATCGLVMMVERRAELPNGQVEIYYPCDSCKGQGYIVEVPVIRPIDRNTKDQPINGATSKVGGGTEHG